MNKEKELIKKLNESKNTPTNKQVLQLQRNFSEISPLALEELLENLQDWNCLNSIGKELRQEFWKTFIRE